MYKGRLRNGGLKVAVKVQRPGVREAIALDVFILRFIAKQARERFSVSPHSLLRGWAAKQRSGAASSIHSRITVPTEQGEKALAQPAAVNSAVAGACNLTRTCESSPLDVHCEQGGPCRSTSGPPLDLQTHNIGLTRLCTICTCHASTYWLWVCR